MSEDVRCYVCGRNIFEVVALFGIEYNKGRAMLEMTPYTFTDEVTLDKKDETVYEFNGWNMLSDFQNSLSPRERSRFQNKWSPRVRKWYKKMEESTGHDGKGISVYAYDEETPYNENGSVLLDDSEVEKIQIEYNYHLCPICQDLYDTIISLARNRGPYPPYRSVRACGVSTA